MMQQSQSVIRPSILVACPHQNQSGEAALRAMSASTLPFGHSTEFLSDLRKIDTATADCREKIDQAYWQNIRSVLDTKTALLADLTPVDNNPEPDPDICLLVGLWTALGLPVQLCTENKTPYFDRVVQWNGKAPQRRLSDPTIFEDKNRMRVENMGGLYNLMLDGPVALGMPSIVVPNVCPNGLGQTALTTAFCQLHENVSQLDVNYKTASLENRQASAPQVLYLAGPYIFQHNANQIYDELKSMLVLHGYEGIAPTDLQLPFAELQSYADPVTGDNPVMRHTIYKADQECMDRSQGALFALDVFRGERDSGTLFELGYELGLKIKEEGKGIKRPLIAYSEYTPSTRLIRAAVSAGLMSFDIIGQSADIKEHVQKVGSLINRQHNIRGDQA